MSCGNSGLFIRLCECMSLNVFSVCANEIWLFYALLQFHSQTDPEISSPWPELLSYVCAYVCLSSVFSTSVPLIVNLAGLGFHNYPANQSQQPLKSPTQSHIQRPPHKHPINPPIRTQSLRMSSVSITTLSVSHQPSDIRPQYKQKCLLSTALFPQHSYELSQESLIMR